MPRVYICPDCGAKAEPSSYPGIVLCQNETEHYSMVSFYFPAAHWPAAFVRDEPSPEVIAARDPKVQRLVAKAIVERGRTTNTHWVVTTVANDALTLEIPND